jgi:hypothetical protein
MNDQEQIDREILAAGIGLTVEKARTLRSETEDLLWLAANEVSYSHWLTARARDLIQARRRAPTRPPTPNSSSS